MLLLLLLLLLRRWHGLRAVRERQSRKAELVVASSIVDELAGARRGRTRWQRANEAGIQQATPESFGVGTHGTVARVAVQPRGGVRAREAYAGFVVVGARMQLHAGGPAEIPAIALQFLMSVRQHRRQIGQRVAEAGIGIFDVEPGADAQPVGHRHADARLDVDRAQLGPGGAVARPAVRRIIGGEAVGRGDRDAERNAVVQRHGDRARGEHAVVDRIASDAVAAHRRRRLPRADDQRAPVGNLAARQDDGGGKRGVATLDAADRGRVPPDRSGAGIGGLAREGTAGAAGGLLLEIEGLGMGSLGEAEQRDQRAAGGERISEGGHRGNPCTRTDTENSETRVSARGSRSGCGRRA